MTYLILFCALLATAVGQSVFLTVLPSLGREAGLTEWQVAVMMSSSAFVFAIGANCWSRVTVKYGYKRLLMVGLSGYTLGTCPSGRIRSHGTFYTCSTHGRVRTDFASNTHQALSSVSL